MDKEDIEDFINLKLKLNNIDLKIQIEFVKINEYIIIARGSTIDKGFFTTYTWSNNLTIDTNVIAIYNDIIQYFKKLEDSEK